MVKKKVSEITAEISALRTKAGQLSDAIGLMKNALKSMAKVDELQPTRDGIQALIEAIEPQIATLNEDIQKLEDKTVS